MPKLPHLRHQSQTKSKTCQFFLIQTRRLATVFEGLTSSIAWRVMELQSGVKTVAHAGFRCMNISYTSAEGVDTGLLGFILSLHKTNRTAVEI